MILALAGNQNCGKTTLFNRLTGAAQHVGNFPGVTVEQKAGPVRGLPGVTLVDLPGIYSLRSWSGDEAVARDFLLQGKPDGIINIVDATNLERNLYLTLQLADLGIPMVLALNMMDEVRGNGGSVDTGALSTALGCPVIPVSAARNEGVSALLEQAMKGVEGASPSGGARWCTGALLRCLENLEAVMEAGAARAAIPPRFAAVKVLEGDLQVEEALGLTAEERALCETGIRDMETSLGADRHTILAGARYAFIDRVCAESVVKGQISRERVRSQRLDTLFTHRYLAIPIFFLIMFCVFALTFGPVGTGLSELLGTGIGAFTGLVSRLMEQVGVHPVLHALVVDGIFAGVGSVLGFLPIIMALFFFLSLLEDSGYMARVVFVMDRPLRSLGLSGRSIVPMLMGFGCTVPAVMAARTLSEERERRLTILLTPFMSCSARLPIYALFTAAFFPRHSAAVMLVLYLMGIGVGILCGLLLKMTSRQTSEAPFLLELPNYRMPSPGTVLLLMWERAKDFLTRAFTVILIASVAIWFLETFNYRLDVVEHSGQSLLGTLGMAIAPVFRPLGFTDWRISTSLITGLIAKEAVVSTLAVLTGAGVAGAEEAVSSLFTPLTAFSFLTFTLLYTPCVAAIAANSRELGSSLAALRVMVTQCLIAWAAAAMVYQVGSFMGLF